MGGRFRDIAQRHCTESISINTMVPGGGVPILAVEFTLDIFRKGAKDYPFVSMVISVSLAALVPLYI